MNIWKNAYSQEHFSVRRAQHKAFLPALEKRLTAAAHLAWQKTILRCGTAQAIKKARGDAPIHTARHSLCCRQQEMSMDKRYEALGEKWLPLVDNPEKNAMALIPKVINEGGTREIWNTSDEKTETMMMAWPKECPLRIGVIMHGRKGEKLTPVTVLPLLEGLAQDMTIEEVHPWSNGACAYVAAARNEDATPLWFQTMFYYRDKEMLSTPGVRQTILLAGMAYGIRPALLDELTVTEGPNYEKFAAEWLEKNPGKTRLDVPQLKVSLRGQSILMPGPGPGDYQLRAAITAVQEADMEGRKIYILPFQLGMDTPAPLTLGLYVTERACNGYVPKVGDEIDALLWLQGRLVD